jgi:hypothetical protein
MRTRGVILIALCFVGGLVGKPTSPLSGNVALVWPLAGIAPAAILQSGCQPRPGVAPSAIKAIALAPDGEDVFG